MVIILISFVTIVNAETANTETWTCSNFSGDETLIIINLIDEYPIPHAEVVVNGKTIRGHYAYAGLDIRVKFGDDYAYTMLIQPNGNTEYYDFSNVKAGESTSPKTIYKCSKI
jgi:hypothetical protein